VLGVVVRGVIGNVIDWLIGGVIGVVVVGLAFDLIGSALNVIVLVMERIVFVFVLGVIKLAIDLT
jgi:hypothetical protein